MIRVADQDENIRALRAFRRCKEERLPLAVIAGNAICFPSQLPLLTTSNNS